MGSHENGDQKLRGLHVVVVPSPAQGHINPLLQFSKHLAHRGLTVTFPTVFSDAAAAVHLPAAPASLTLQQVSLLPYDGAEPETPAAFWERTQTSVRLHLTELIARHETAGEGVACVVYDAMMPWILDVARELGVRAAAFFTQSFAVNSIYYSVHKGWMDVPLQRSFVCFDGFPVLQAYELPSFIFDPTKYPFILGFLADQFSRLKDADWIFVNTFDSLEPQVNLSFHYVMSM